MSDADTGPNGFPEYSGDEALVSMSGNPRTPTVFDEYGNPLASGTTDNADPSSSFPIDDRIVEFIQYGVLNGTFARGPADPNHDITDINPLPDWTGPTTVQGGSITCQWVTDASSPSGYNLRFTFNEGVAALDEVYFEQIVPIGGSRWGILGDSVRLAAIRSSGTAADNTIRLKLQYLDASLNTVGSETVIGIAVTSSVTFITNSASNLVTPDPSSRFLRIRISARSTFGNVNALDISEVRREAVRPEFVLADQVDTSVGQGYLISRSGTWFLAPPNSQPVYLTNGQLSFPATQVPSSNVNTLDDYEESNSWTPAMRWATAGTSSISHSNQVGTYTKIGRVVFFQFVCAATVTRGTGSGNFQINGFPFTSMNVASSLNRFAVEMTGYTKAGYTWVVGLMNINDTTANLRASGSAQSVAFLSGSDITDGTVSIAGSGFYFAAD